MTKQQTKISDSKSFICSLQYFNTNVNKRSNQPNNKFKSQKQLHYVIACTFDLWLTIKTIDVKNISWNRVFDLRVAMPVVNSFIEFNQDFQPEGLVLAYFDGTIQYTSWVKLQRNYKIQIQSALNRKSPKNYLQIIQQTNRPHYLNTLIDQTTFNTSIQQLFVLETICFIYKKQDFIYVLNYKGQLKIFQVQNQKTIEEIFKFKFAFKIVKCQLINEYDSYQRDEICIGICFQSKFCPFLFKIHPNIKHHQLEIKFQGLNQRYQTMYEEQYKVKQNIKLMLFDRNRKQIIVCSDYNQIRFFSYEETDFLDKDILIICHLQKAFSIPMMKSQEKSQGKSQAKSQAKSQKLYQKVSDMSLLENKLVIIGQSPFYYYDLSEGIIFKNERLSKDPLVHIARMVDWHQKQMRPILLIKKKFDIQSSLTKPSTTMHLFVGK